MKNQQPAPLLNYSYRIYHLTGSLAGTGTLTKNSIPLPFLKNGLYIIQVFNEKVISVHISKFLKQ
ncbi:MAG: hypothetical protein GX459_08655 [Bacteroidales bacterium]|nr:hypothetical protein [Bacteroidales bacterium]